MKIGWGVIAGLGTAGLLTMAVPAEADEKAQTGQTAQEPAAQKPETAGAVAGQDELTGKVQKIDHEKQTLMLEDKELKLTDSTTIMKDGQPASHADIKEGDEVRASFSGDTLEVRSIEVMTAGAAESAAPGEKPAGEAPAKTPPSK